MSSLSVSTPAAQWFFAPLEKASSSTYQSRLVGSGAGGVELGTSMEGSIVGRSQEGGQWCSFLCGTAVVPNVPTFTGVQAAVIGSPATAPTLGMVAWFPWCFWGSGCGKSHQAVMPHTQHFKLLTAVPCMRLQMWGSEVLEGRIHPPAALLVSTYSPTYGSAVTGLKYHGEG